MGRVFVRQRQPQETRQLVIVCFKTQKMLGGSIGFVRFDAQFHIFALHFIAAHFAAADAVAA